MLKVLSCKTLCPQLSLHSRLLGNPKLRRLGMFLLILTVLNGIVVPPIKISMKDCHYNREQPNLRL